MRLAVRVLSIVVAATLLTAPAGAEDWPDRIMERMEALQLPDESLALAAGRSAQPPLAQGAPLAEGRWVRSLL